MTQSLAQKSILLVISGGIAAYKSLELIRLIRKSGGRVRCILTQGGAQFITPLSVASVSGEPVYTDLWSLKDEAEMGHIRLSREADLIVVAPASANMIAKMAWGLADDLAAATLLAADKPILIAPAMNHMMWSNAATQENIKTLQARGIQMIGPGEGEMACNEFGTGRMSEPQEILEHVQKSLSPEGNKKLVDLHALVTAGPTYEPIDPVRFIGNRSSGKQGYAIAAALAAAGAKVTLVSGPVCEAIALPLAVHLIKVGTAREMLAACESALPADIAVCAAAVADWAPDSPADRKIKKQFGKSAPAITLQENPDILRTLSAHARDRPRLVVGFAAETDNLLENAKAKLKSKGCDWIVANDVSENPFGLDTNQVYLMTPSSTEKWDRLGKRAVADALAAKIGEYFANAKHTKSASE